MVIETSLAHTSIFSESMNVKVAPAVEKTIEEQAREAKVPEQSQEQGDTVSISEKARALSAVDKGEESETGFQSGIESGASTENDDLTNAELAIKRLKEAIKRIEDEIKEIEDDPDLSEKMRQQKIAVKQTELLEMREQLNKAMEEQLKKIGATPYGGTRAQGAGGSVADF